MEHQGALVLRNFANSASDLSKIAGLFSVGWANYLANQREPQGESHAALAGAEGWEGGGTVAVGKSGVGVGVGVGGLQETNKQTIKTTDTKFLRIRLSFKNQNTHTNATVIDSRNRPARSCLENMRLVALNNIQRIALSVSS